MTHGSKTIDVTRMFSEITISNCNGGTDNWINSTQAGILRDVGRTIIHMDSQDCASARCHDRGGVRTDLFYDPHSQSWANF